MPGLLASRANFDGTMGASGAGTVPKIVFMHEEVAKIGTLACKVLQKRARFGDVDSIFFSGEESLLADVLNPVSCVPHGSADHSVPRFLLENLSHKAFTATAKWAAFSLEKMNRISNPPLSLPGLVSVGCSQVDITGLPCGAAFEHQVHLVYLVC